MRTDKRQALPLAAELREGRMRQGWGYRPELDLRRVREKRTAGQELSDSEKGAWRRCRRLLPEESNSVKEGDLVMLPHLPKYRTWAIALVQGDYRFEPLEGFNDYGHIRDVQLLAEGVSWDHPGVHAALRATMRTQLPLWNIDALGADVQALVASLDDSPASARYTGDRLFDVFSELRQAAWTQLDKRFNAGEFEREAIQRLLETMFGADGVQHTAGPRERGADFICQHTDALGSTHQIAVQVKKHTGTMGDDEALRQIGQARNEWPLVTSGVVLTTAERISDSVQAVRDELETQLNIPIQMILRDELMGLFIRYLPELANTDD